MKIEQNYDNLMKAWMLTASSLDIVKALFIDNVKNEVAKDAYYDLLGQLNRWHDEIKEMPF